MRYGISSTQSAHWESLRKARCQTLWIFPPDLLSEKRPEEFANFSLITIVWTTYISSSRLVCLRDISGGRNTNHLQGWQSYVVSSVSFWVLSFSLLSKLISNDGRVSAWVIFGLLSLHKVSFSQSGEILWNILWGSRRFYGISCDALGYHCDHMFPEIL